MKSAKMSTILVLALGLMVCSVKVSQAAPMGTAFTYQGRLMDKNKPADGLYDFQFKLYDSNDPNTGTQLGSPIDINDLDVIDGHFVVELDFGSGIFDGNSVWLDIDVRPGDSNDPNDFVVLSPRQEITPTPYALQTRGIFVDNVLNVGIGTTSPVGKLHVDGGKAMDGTWGADVVIKAQDGGDGWEMQNNGVAGGDIILLPGEGGEEYGVGFPGPDGNVGIGTSTPARKLEVRDTEAIARLTSDGSVGSRLELHNINEDPDTLGFINFSHDPSGIHGQIAYSWDGMDFKTANMQRMRIHKNGYVGIGTKEPTRDLHIYRNAGPAQVGIVTADTSSKAQVIFGDGAGNKWTISSDNTDDNKLHFRSGHASGTPRVTFQQNGYVGIGTTSPGGILEVSHDGVSKDFLIHESTGNVGIGVSNPDARLHIEQGGAGTENLLRVISFGNGQPGLFSVANPDNIYPALRVYSVSKSAPALYVAGRARVDILEVTGADIAEKFPVSEKAKPGMVLAIDPEHPGQLCLSRGTYNRCVAGVVSGANGLPTGAVLGNLPGQEDAIPVALSGRVWAYCDANEHPIEPGNLLTTAKRPGYAMTVTDFEKAHGAVIGKAMTRLEKGKTGLVLVLVNLQ